MKLSRFSWLFGMLLVFAAFPAMASADDTVLVSPIMTGPSAPSPYVASDLSHLTGNDGWKAFNGAVGTFSDSWVAAVYQTAGWLKLDFGAGEGKVVTGYKMDNTGLYDDTSPDLNSNSPKTWTFEGSDNNSTWVVLDTRTNIGGWNTQPIKTFSFTNETSYRYYRINITSNNGATRYVGIGELQLYAPIDTTPPAVPSGLTAAPDITRVNLSWQANAEPDVNSYKIYKNGAYLATVHQPATSYIVEGVANNSWYTFEITAIDSSGNESEKTPPIQSIASPVNLVSPIMTGASAPSPYVASDLSHLAGNDGWKAFDGAVGTFSDSWVAAVYQTAGWLKLDFGAGEGKVVTGYKMDNTGLYDDTSPDLNSNSPKSWTFEGSNNNSTWIVLDTRTNIGGWNTQLIKTFSFTNETSYRYYRINITGNNGATRYVGIGELQLYGPLQITPPAAPTGLASALGDGKVDLSWTANTETYLAGYKVYRNGAHIATVNKPATSYTASGLSNGTAYTFEISAYDFAGNESPKSEVVAVTPLAAPSNLTATGGSSQIVLTWDASTGATGYDVERAATAGGPYDTVAWNVSSPTYIDEDVQPDVTYYYTVTARNDSGASARSNEAFASLAPTSNPNLLVNGGFELYTGVSGVADGWSRYKGAAASYQYTVVANPTAEGVQAQQVIASGIPANTTIAVHQTITTATPGHTYKVSGKINAPELTNAKVRVYVEFMKENRSFIPGGYVTLAEQAEVTDGYITLQGTFVPPAETYYTKVWVMLQATEADGAGTMVLDDFALTLQ